MRDIMFEIPSNPLIEKCIITEETVLNKENPKIIINTSKEIREVKTKQERKTTNKKNIETA